MLAANEKLQNQGICKTGPGVLAVTVDSDLTMLKGILEKEKIVVHTKGIFMTTEDEDEEDFYHYR